MHRAEQVLLLARLAADSGARRGELAALQFADLDGDVLTISRGVSNEVLGPTKNRRIRRVTLGATAADLWRQSVERWRSQAGPPFGPWVFSAVPDHSRRLSTSALGHWFATLTLDAGIRMSPYTASATPSRQPLSPRVISCKRSTGWATATPPPRFACTATYCR